MQKAGASKNNTNHSVPTLKYDVNHFEKTLNTEN